MDIYLRKPTYLLLALALLLQACAPAVVEQPEPVELKVVLLPFLSFAPFFIAEEEGYFAEQGLKIEFVRLSGAEEAIPALVQGELDVGAGTISSALLNAMAKGTNIKFVADKGYLPTNGCTYVGFLARRDLVEGGELKSPEQLKGRRVALEHVASRDGYQMEKLLEMGHLTLDDIEPVAVSLPAQLEAFEKGTIDLTGTGEPWITRLASTGHAVLWVPAQQVIPDFQIAFIVYGPTLLEENPDVGERFMVAYLRAVRQYSEGKTERNLEILAEHTGLELELLTQACWPALRNDGQINAQSVLDFQAWAVEKGYLDNSVTEDQFWDPSFVEHANEVLEASSQ